jgi:hypothetical protein
MSKAWPGLTLFSALPRQALRRPRRALAWAAAVTVLDVLAPLPAAADARADQAFDARCAELPASRYDVAEVPISYELRDGSQTIDQLTVSSGYTPKTHMTFGLTTVSFGYEAETEIGVVEETGTGRVCGSLNAHVKLSMQPVIVYLAQELGSSTCARGVTLEHEVKHIAVFQQVLTEAARDLNVDIAATMGRQVRRANSRDELERNTSARLKDYLSEFIRRWQRTLDERQTAVDSPAEHARVKNACLAAG